MTSMERQGIAYRKMQSEYKELKEALRNFVDAIDLLVDCGGILSEERRQVYLSIKNSLTYEKAKTALKNAE